MVSDSSKKALLLISKDFGLGVLKVAHNIGLDLTVCHPNDFQDSRSRLKEVKNFCREHKIRFEFDPSHEELVSIAADGMFSFVFVCGWYKLLKAEFLEASGHNVYGIHNSPLPKYRGGAPLVWQIINDEPVIGSSLFMIQPGIDDGNIVAQIFFELSDDDDISTVTKRIERAWLCRLPDIFLKIVSKSVDTTPQDDSLASFVAQRKPSDGLIDWTMDRRQVFNFIRAQCAPYPGAFTFIGMRKIVIHKVEMYDCKVEVCGSMSADLSALFFRCGDGNILKVTHYVNLGLS